MLLILFGFVLRFSRDPLRGENENGGFATILSWWTEQPPANFVEFSRVCGWLIA